MYTNAILVYLSAIIVYTNAILVYISAIILIVCINAIKLQLDVPANSIDAMIVYVCTLC